LMRKDQEWTRVGIYEGVSAHVCSGKVISGRF
jgi:hypothetical protein